MEKVNTINFKDNDYKDDNNRNNNFSKLGTKPQNLRQLLVE